MATCFTEDAVFEPSQGAYKQQGGSSIVRFFADLTGPTFVSSHVVSHPEIELTTPTSAQGRWRLEDTVHYTGPNPAVKTMTVAGHQTLRGAAYYYDRYQKTDAGWRISYLTFVRIFRTITDWGSPAVDFAADPSHGLLAGWP